ncbi:MAG: hypothetical protein IT310_13510 [Anaerolineales bacterium]|nr:hypothetical protein [Anaerolineales bacterium]
MDTFIDVIGWIGAILYLLAYWLVSAKKAEGDSWTYQGLNFVAGALLTVNTLYLRAYPSAGLNIVWMLIAIFTLGKKTQNPNA